MSANNYIFHAFQASRHMFYDCVGGRQFKHLRNILFCIYAIPRYLKAPEIYPDRNQGVILILAISCV